MAKHYFVLQVQGSQTGIAHFSNAKEADAVFARNAADTADLVSGSVQLSVFSNNQLLQIHNAVCDPAEAESRFKNKNEACEQTWSRLLVANKNEFAFPELFALNAEGAEGSATTAKKSGKVAKAPKVAKGERAPKEGGVIAGIVEVLSNGGGTTNEIFEVLKEKFPDRAAKGDGMLTTVRIQVQRLRTRGHNIVATKVPDRGTVYAIA